MKFIYGVVLSLTLTSTTALAKSRIVCEPKYKGNIATSIWPTPYLSDNGALCFDVKGSPEYSGQNCVKNGGRTTWTGLVIVDVDGQSQGRGPTSFRVIKPKVNDDSIQYTIEWSRGSGWSPMQRISINRLTGEAVSYFITEHGGESYQCRLEKQRL